MTYSTETQFNITSGLVIDVIANCSHLHYRSLHLINVIKIITSMAFYKWHSINCYHTNRRESANFYSSRSCDWQIEL